MAKKKKQTPSAKLVHHAKHLLVPHKGNQYRPHLIRWRGLAAVLAIIVVSQAVYGFATTGHVQVLGKASDIAISDLLADTNVQREKAGLPDLNLNTDLDKAAYLKGQDMIANNYWAHNSPTGVTPWKWFGDVGYDYNSAGENLAKNYPTAQATLDAWMASPTHKANVLGDKYQDVGFAVVEGTIDNKETTIVVAEYGEPATAAVNGAQAPVTYASPVNSSNSTPLASFGSIIQGLNPATVGILGLLAIVGIVAAAAHHYRKKLPKAWQKSWKIHHGAYTFAGVMVFMVVIVIASGGGQI